MKKLASIAMLLMAMASPSLAANEPQAILLAAGDITGCDDQDIKHAASTAAVLAREIRAAQQEHVPVKAVILGDLAYGEGTKAQFECFHRAWGKVLDESLSDPKSGVLPVPGNHDYKTQNGAAYYRYYESNRQVGPEHQPYYQLSFPAEWLILGLNSEIDGTAKSAQYAWLKKNLAASAEPCVLALWHRPVFSSGRHGHEENDDLAGAKPVKQTEMAAIESLLFASGASVVMNGHDHDYEELGPHDDAGKPAESGLRSFVVGTGGRSLYANYAKRWPGISRNFDSTSLGILKFSLYPDHYAWSFLPIGPDSAAKYGGEATCNLRKPAAN